MRQGTFGTGRYVFFRHQVIPPFFLRVDGGHEGKVEVEIALLTKGLGLETARE